MDQIRVLVVDDHSLFRRGVCDLLAEEKDIDVVGEASSGREAFSLAEQLMPDLILMDVFMPGGNGIEATRNIKKKFPYVKIIVLTVSEREESLFEAIKGGAQGYLLKNVEPEELLSGLRGAARGETPISHILAPKILDDFTRLSNESNRDPTDDLTPREKEVLGIVATGATNKLIAAELSISESTVKNHLRNIMEKLHLHNRAEAAVFGSRAGLAPPPKGDSPLQS